MSHEDKLKQTLVEALANSHGFRYNHISAYIANQNGDHWLVLNVDGKERAIQYDITNNDIDEKLIDLFEIFRRVKRNLEWYE